MRMRVRWRTDSQSAWVNALLIPISLVLKRSRAGSPLEYREVEVGQPEEGDRAPECMKSGDNTLINNLVTNFLGLKLPLS
jgi:hypothetical protein